MTAQRQREAVAEVLVEFEDGLEGLASGEPARHDQAEAGQQGVAAAVAAAWVGDRVEGLQRERGMVSVSWPDQGVVSLSRMARAAPISNSAWPWR